ncbi:MAG: Gfo/Idh/MocA family oxidoreductase, partial [Gammaproteobacteria bacterium]|nr:Gfo/Idh/MocA family oxidoreductase [Gammaproteobacteria bacterium]
FVGTGNIASWMAHVVRTTPAATLGAVASRDMDKAQSFAAEHGAQQAYDSWQEMLEWEAVDAVYVATPTSLREEVSVAAAVAGKHVLAEKPFASLPSLERITAACRKNGVGFMDATHFVHHPRYAAIRKNAAKIIGRPRLLDTRFLVQLTDRNDIRYNPALEPLGAIGDLGWYNMRAILEYLAPTGPARNVTTRVRRDPETGVIIAGKGTLAFNDGMQSSWQCRFDGASVDIGLDLAGADGVLRMANFVGEDDDHSASYHCAGSSASTSAGAETRITSQQSGPALMFTDFAALTRNTDQREHWMQASERTQALLDTVLAAAGT